jgi:hypothetical protein
MYIVKCYCFKDSKTANLIIPYKTKKAAEKRKNDAINSGCYYKVDIIKSDFYSFVEV